MKKNKMLYVILKMEYGSGEENVFAEVLNASSSRSTALAIKERYDMEYEEQMRKPVNGRWVSIQLHQFAVQIDDEILEDDIFLRFIDGSSRMCRQQTPEK